MRLVASAVLFPDNQSEAKHVESKWLPRLDEGSNPSSSTINVEYHLRIKKTHEIVPLKGFSCVFLLSLL